MQFTIYGQSPFKGDIVATRYQNEGPGAQDSLSRWKIKSETEISEGVEAQIKSIVDVMSRCEDVCRTYSATPNTTKLVVKCHFNGGGLWFDV